MQHIELNELTDDSPIKIEDNPFFVSVGGGSLSSVTYPTLLADYSEIYIICSKEEFHNAPETKLFYEKDTKIDSLVSCKDRIMLVKAPMSIARIYSIKIGLVIVSGDILHKFDESVEPGHNKLAYLMLYVDNRHVKNWIATQCESRIDLFVELKMFTTYYNINDYKTAQYMVELIKNAAQLDYWSDIDNCNLSTLKIKHRKFGINQGKKWDTMNLQTGDYPVAVETTQRDKKDKSSGSYYEIPSYNEILNETHVMELLDGKVLSREEIYYLVMSLLASKKYCHYIIKNFNNATIKSITSGYKLLTKYLMGYAWISLLMEENIKKSKMSTYDRCVLTLDQAAALPIFDFDQEKPHKNPYFAVTLPDTEITNNILGVHNDKKSQQGIISMDKFVTRLNIFITDEDINVFKGIDWSNTVITGGCMAAILPKCNPLMGATNVTAPILRNFFNKYYSTSDIDIACRYKNTMKYIEHVKKTTNIIVENVIAWKKTKVTPNINLNKTLAIYVSEEILKKKCANNEIPFEFDYIKDNKEDNSVKIYFYNLYVEGFHTVYKKNAEILGKKIHDEIYYRAINQVSLDDTKVIINPGNMMSYDDSESDDILKVPGIAVNGESYIIFSEILKYKIQIAYLKHPLEFFRISYKDFFECVSRFHLPCVRAYYDGTTCYLLPSSIISYHTLTNINITYFAGSRDPISIINKYRSRGYGIILNKYEIIQLENYIMSDCQLKKKYTHNTGNPIITGVLMRCHPVFGNCPHDIDYETVIETRTKSMLEIICDMDIINKYGKIVPFQKWIIDAVFSLDRSVK